MKLFALLFQRMKTLTAVFTSARYDMMLAICIYHSDFAFYILYLLFDVRLSHLINIAYIHTYIHTSVCVSVTIASVVTTRMHESSRLTFRHRGYSQLSIYTVLNGNLVISKNKGTSLELCCKV